MRCGLRHSPTSFSPVMWAYLMSGVCARPRGTCERTVPICWPSVLKYSPRPCRRVEYDTPADEATRNACKVEPVCDCREQEHRVRAARSAGKNAAPVCESRGARGWTSGAITRTDSRFIARMT